MDERIHEIKLFGRGGQGIVTAGDLLSRSAELQGMYAQSIPTFGPERRGGPSICSLRFSNMPILLKCAVTRPEIICVFDQTIWHHVNILAGLEDGATLIFNTQLSPREVEERLKDGRYNYRLERENYSIWAVDGTKIAMERLGRPITNTAMMGAFAKATELVRMESVEEVIKARFKDTAEQNITAARDAHRLLKKL